MKNHIMGNSRKLNAGNGVIRLFMVFCSMILLAAPSVFAASTEEQIAALKNQRSEAIFQVEHIVNQPVTSFKRTSDMSVSTYPGWFHDGAITPNFNSVDVRTTQENPYEGHQYVASDLNPGVVFPGHELEFNSMIKYFYTDRSVPKKRLTEAEMVEINSLYRIIGYCDQRLEELENPPPMLSQIHLWLTTHKPIVVATVAVLVVILFLVRRNQRATAEE
jgi:hypothetical protein